MLGSLRACVVVFLSIGLSAAASARELTFEQRVRAQEAIERVYYGGQIGNTRPFDEAVPRQVLERKVATYLDQSAALEKLWNTPVTDEMLLRELQRMAAHSRAPERLRELYAALGNDLFLMQECLARATLVDRLARNLYGFDESLHARARAEAEELRRGLERSGVLSFLDDPRGTVVEISRVGFESAAGSSRASGDLRRIDLGPGAFARWRASAPAGVGQIGPVRAERDAFVTSVVLDEDAASARIAYFTVRKRTWDQWWTGAKANLDPREVRAVADGDASPPAALAGPGDRSAPPVLAASADDGWDDGSLDGLTQARSNHARVWTGSLMVVWGGYNGLVLNTGGRYDPATDSWTEMTTVNAPPPCEHPSAMWTGSVAVFRPRQDTRLASAGGRYDPATDTWSARSLDVEAGAILAPVDAAPVDAAPVDAAPVDAGGNDIPVTDPAPAGPVPPAQGSGTVPVAGDPSDSDPGPIMAPISASPNGFTFPTNTPIVSDIFLGSQGTDFGYCQAGPSAGLACSVDANCPGSVCERTFDNTFCLSYNMSCAGVKTNDREYGFQDVFEATYDHSASAGRQTWIERNWNYVSPDGTAWRPLGFVLEVDANSTCVGGTNEGAFCTLLDVAGVCTGGGTCTGKSPTGGASWSFKPNNRDGNASLLLRWPWAAINTREGTDPYWANGFSTWMRTSDFNPGTTASAARFTNYVDHSNDRRGPWINGVSSTIDFNTVNVGGKVGMLNAGYFDARISGATPSRTITALTGLRSEVNLASTGGPQTLPQSYGVLVQFNPTGTGIVDTSHTGVLIGTPAPPGVGTVIGTQNGLWVADQQLVRSGGGGSAILISSQTVTDGTEGNLRMDGGNWNTGHIQLYQAHLWRDATRKVLRYSGDKAPESESDGNALVMGTGSDSHGVVLWGVTTSIDPNFDTGDEVCAADRAGLTCVSTFNIGGTGSQNPIACNTAHTASARWMAFCK